MAYQLVGDGSTDNSRSLQALLDKGGEIRISKGVYRTGPITLHSDTHLILEEGAELSFLDDPELYEPVYTRWEGVRCYAMHPLVFIDQAENVRISGKGCINGNGQSWWKEARAKKSQKCPMTAIEKKLASLNPDYQSQASGGGGRASQFLRPPLLQIYQSKKVSIEGITLTNSPFWTLHPLFSQHLELCHLVIQNPYDSPNTDGVDIDSCSDVLVDACKVFVGDDGICIKSGSGKDGIEAAAPSDHITIRNCYVAKAHGGAVIGSETAAGIGYVTVEDSVFDSTDRGIRIKSRRGRGGDIHDLVFRNLEVRDTLCPIAVNMFYRCGTDDSPESLRLFSLEKLPVTKETPSIRNVTIEGIHATGTKASATLLLGIPEMPIENLTIRHCSIEMDETAENSPEESDMYRGLPEAEGKGIRIRYAKSIVLEDVSVKGCKKAVLLEEGAELK